MVAGRFLEWIRGDIDGKRMGKVNLTAGMKEVSIRAVNLDGITGQRNLHKTGRAGMEYYDNTVCQHTFIQVFVTLGSFCAQILEYSKTGGKAANGPLRKWLTLPTIISQRSRQQKCREKQLQRLQSPTRRGSNARLRSASICSGLRHARTKRRGRF